MKLRTRARRAWKRLTYRRRLVVAARECKYARTNVLESIRSLEKRIKQYEWHTLLRDQLSSQEEDLHIQFDRWLRMHYRIRNLRHGYAPFQPTRLHNGVLVPDWEALPHEVIDRARRMHDNDPYAVYPPAFEREI